MPEIKFTCPKCKQPLECDDSMSGQIVECPSCKEQLTVPSEQKKQTSLPKSGFHGTSTAFNPPPRRSLPSGEKEMIDLKPRVERNETNGLSQAESVRDRIYDMFEEAASDHHVEVLLLKSPPFTSPPWVRVECWLRHSQDSALTLRSSAEFRIRPREFHRFPVEIDLTISNDKRRRLWMSIIAFEAQDAKNVLDYLLFERKSHKFGFRRCRLFPLQLWRPRNKPARLGRDPLSIVTTILFIVGFFTMGLFGLGLLLILIGAIVAYFGAKRRRHVLSSGKPAQEPRELIRLDSWQTLVRGLGGEREPLISALQQQLSAIKQDGFSVGNESIWYWGVDGKEERVQMVARFRRAMSFIHVYSYGDDLFVGWDAHVNCGDWVEKVAGVGYDKNTSELCTVHTIDAGWHVPTEYDITDANCLLERVHAAVTKVVKLKLAEHKVDQEIDFRILREERQGIKGREQSGKDIVTSGIRSVVSRFRRIG